MRSRVTLGLGLENPLVKSGYANADVKCVKCREILRRLSLDVIGKLGLGLSLRSVIGLESELGLGLALGRHTK